MDETSTRNPQPDDEQGLPDRAKLDVDFARRTKDIEGLLAKYAKRCNTELEDFTSEWVVRVYPWYLAADPNDLTFLAFAKTTAENMAKELGRTSRRWERSKLADPKRPTSFSYNTQLEEIIYKESSQLMSLLIASLSDEQKSFIRQRLSHLPMDSTNRSAGAQRAAFGRLLRRIVLRFRNRYWNEHGDEPEK